MFLSLNLLLLLLLFPDLLFSPDILFKLLLIFININILSAQDRKLLLFLYLIQKLICYYSRIVIYFYILYLFLFIFSLCLLHYFMLFFYLLFGLHSFFYELGKVAIGRVIQIGKLTQYWIFIILWFIWVSILWRSITHLIQTNNNNIYRFILYEHSFVLYIL